VEFVARCRALGGKAQRLHEISRFLRERGRWYYIDGQTPDEVSVRFKVPVSGRFLGKAAAL